MDFNFETLKVYFYINKTGLLLFLIFALYLLIKSIFYFLINPIGFSNHFYIKYY